MTLILLLLAAIALGRQLVPDAWRLVAAETWLFRLLTGMAVAALVVLLLGSASLTAAQVALAGIAAVGLVRWRARGGVDHADVAEPAPLAPFEKVSLAAIAGAFVLTLIGALAPVTSWDAAVAHLALPSDYARAGRIYLHPGNVYSGYPHLMHCLFASVYHHGGALPTTVLSWLFGVAACAAVYLLGRRIESRRVGLTAAALLATAPIFMDQAGTVSIDLAFTAFATAALAAVVAWFDEKRLRWLVLAGLLAGSACGVRHTGYVVCVLLAVGVLAGRSPRRIRAVACFSTAALVAALPWLARSALLSGNPVFPLLSGWFPSSAIEHIAVGGAHESLSRSGGSSLVGFLRFPWDIIMRPGRFDGWTKSPGGMVLILGLPGLLLGSWRVRNTGLYGVAGCALFYFFQRFARYMLPFFTPLMVVAAAAVERTGKLRKGVLAVLAATYLFGLALHGAAIHFKVPVVLGLQSRAAYLTSRVERYPAFAYVNEHLGDGTVLTIDQRSYYINGPSYQNHWALKRIAGLPLKEQVAWLREQGIRYILLPLDFVEASGAIREDVGAMVDVWRRTPGVFEAVCAPMDIPSPKGGLDRVEIYRVKDAKAP